MPELPEVETIRRDLEDLIVGLKIEKTEIKDSKINLGARQKTLKGNSILKIDRIGKLLVFELKDGQSLLIHLKMTGQLVFCGPAKLVGGGHPFKKGSFWDNTGGVLPNKHTRFLIHFQGSKRLFFNDIRRFGYVKIVSREEKEKIFAGFGPEPLKKDFNFKNLKEALGNRKISIKAALLNQEIIAGIGNIYADETLFEAGIDPGRPAGELTDEEIKKIVDSARRVIKKAIKYRGTTFSNYLDGQGQKGNYLEKLKVYGREGEKCPKCGGKIKKTNLASRSTFYCPKCQS